MGRGALINRTALKGCDSGLIFTRQTELKSHFNDKVSPRSVTDKSVIHIDFLPQLRISMNLEDATRKPKARGGNVVRAARGEFNDPQAQIRKSEATTYLFS